MVTGIFAGDPDRMSLRSCFPVIYDLERKYGGLVVGMLGVRKERAKQGVRGRCPRDRERVMSFDHGVQALTDALAGRLAEGLHLNVAVDRIERDGEAFVLSMSANGMREEMAANVVVIATPAYAAAGMASPLDEGLSELLAGIPYAPVTVAALGYRKATGQPSTGSASSSAWGEGKILGRCGIRASSRTGRRRECLLRVMWEGCAPCACGASRGDCSPSPEGVAGDPGISADRPREYVLPLPGIPQYLVGHGERGADLRRLAGFPAAPQQHAYRGIALNDASGIARDRRADRHDALDNSARSEHLRSLRRADAHAFPVPERISPEPLLFWYLPHR